MNNLEIAIGEKIKSFRKKREITQEQLADYLNISFQSVSKWECGEAYPDITMLPKIAMFFGITTDELLCIDRLQEKEDIEKYNERKRNALHIGNVKEAVAAMREVNAKYPGNFGLMNDLVQMLQWDLYDGTVVDMEHQQTTFKEIISIGEKIRAECKDDQIRREILQYMCTAYRCIGQDKKAIELANENLSDINLSKEIVLENLLSGDELTKHRQENLLKFLRLVFGELKCLSSDLTPEDTITAYEIILDMYFFIFKDGDYILYSMDMTNIYTDLAGIYLKQENNAQALENLRNAAEYAILFDDTVFRIPYTSPLVNKMDSVGLLFVKTYKGNQTWYLLKKFEKEEYDIIRDTPEFIEICENLKQYAKEEA